VLGGDLLTIPGGKGANQAVAAARLGGAGHMVGRVGDDDFGRQLLAGLAENAVNTDHVTVTPGTPSGCAMILVDDQGENSIVVSPGANARVTPADVDAAEPLIRSAAVVVLQLEIPLPAVRRAITLCRRHGVFTILDPAPVPSIPLAPALFRVDLLTPNEPEAAQLAAAAGNGPRRRAVTSSPDRLAKSLLSRGPARVVLKLGGRGAFAQEQGGEPVHVKPFKVEVVDTTAAGDAFTGALAVAVSEGRELADAVRFANAAGAACCTRLGAQPALPRRDDVERLLRTI
jgi:ribokinase